MMNPRQLCLGGLFLAMCGCSGEPEPYRKPTSEVTGQVFVDGVPVPAEDPLQVMCHDIDGFDTEYPSVSKTLTGEDGKFAISTYESGDGVPPGSYAVTFFWGKMDLMAMSYVGPDRLKGKYNDPENAEIVINVIEGVPTEMGEIQLTTSGSGSD